MRNKSISTLGFHLIRTSEINLYIKKSTISYINLSELTEAVKKVFKYFISL